MFSTQVDFWWGLDTIVIYPDQTSIFWDHVICRVPFYGRKRGGGYREGRWFDVWKKAYLVYLVASSFAGIEIRLRKSWVEKNHFIYFDNSTVSKWTDSKCWRVLAYHVERLNSLALSSYSEGDKFLLAMDLQINFSVDLPKLLSGNVCRLSCNNQQLKIKWAALRRLSVYIF